jgi:hypothetical protein
MTLPCTKAILEVLRRGREEKLASKILRVFGASTIDEASPRMTPSAQPSAPPSTRLLPE